MIRVMLQFFRKNYPLSFSPKGEMIYSFPCGGRMGRGLIRYKSEELLDK